MNYYVRHASGSCEAEAPATPQRHRVARVLGEDRAGDDAVSLGGSWGGLGSMIGSRGRRPPMSCCACGGIGPWYRFAHFRSSGHVLRLHVCISLLRYITSRPAEGTIPAPPRSSHCGRRGVCGHELLGETIAPVDAHIAHEASLFRRFRVLGRWRRRDGGCYCRRWATGRKRLPRL